MADLPQIGKKHRIRVICEGDEDFSYFKRLINLKVWNEIYDFIPINANGASNIPARFQDDYQNSRYEIILIFCDTDKEPYREYFKIKNKINSYLNKQKAAAKLIIFANPCTMQIILSHFGDIALKSQGKKTNADIIEKYTGVKNYDAHKDQIKEICDKIHRRSYIEMKNRVNKIYFSDETSCSTNFSIFLDRFESDDLKWMTEIQKYLKE